MILHPFSLISHTLIPFKYNRIKREKRGKIYLPRYIYSGDKSIEINKSTESGSIDYWKGV